MRLTMLNRFIPFFVATLVPSLALAQDAALGDPTALVGQLIEAFKGGNWSVFASVIVLIVVWGLTKAPGLSGLIKGKAKVWVASVCGMLLAIAATFISTGDWMAAISNGFTVGLAATGLFELIKRKVAKQPIDENGDGQLDPLETKAE